MTPDCQLYMSPGGLVHWSPGETDPAEVDKAIGIYSR